MTAIKDTVASGLIKYNSLTFSPVRFVELKSTTQWDDAQVTVIGVRYQMTVQALIWGTSTANIQTKAGGTNAVQDALMEPGQTLVIEDIGIDTAINTRRGAGEFEDVIWGPKPISCDAVPLGGTIAWEVTWTVEFTRAPRSCTLPNGPSGLFMAFNWDITYEVREGFVTRTIVGYVQIAQNRATASRLINRDLESAWDRIVIRVPTCFQRDQAERRINAARNRIDFTIVDSEQRNFPYPDGIIHADASYEFENQNLSFESWTAVLQASMEVAQGYSPSLAGEKFFLMLADKMASLSTAAGNSGGTVIPIKLRLGSDPFGRESRFSAVISVFACLQEIIQSAGLWKPVSGTSYQTWAASMNAVGIWDRRGRYKLRHSKTDDAIIDLCAQADTTDIGNDTGGCVHPNQQRQKTFLCPPGSPYIYWDNALFAEQEQNVVIHRISQLFKGLTTFETGGQGTEIPFGQAGQGNYKDHVTQYDSVSDDFVIMVGRAIRLKDAPEIPILRSLGGQPVEEVARKVKTKPIAHYFGCTAIGSQWAILYRVKGQIKFVKPPNNKDEFCFIDGENDGRT